MPIADKRFVQHFHRSRFHMLTDVFRPFEALSFGVPYCGSRACHPSSLLVPATIANSLSCIESLSEVLDAVKREQISVVPLSRRTAMRFPGRTGDEDQVFTVELHERIVKTFVERVSLQNCGSELKIPDLAIDIPGAIQVQLSPERSGCECPILAGFRIKARRAFPVLVSRQSGASIGRIPRGLCEIIHIRLNRGKTRLPAVFGSVYRASSQVIKNSRLAFYQ